jgi:hypothetical protein
MQEERVLRKVYNSSRKGLGRYEPHWEASRRAVLAERESGRGEREPALAEDLGALEASVLRQLLLRLPQPLTGKLLREAARSGRINGV